MSANSVDLVVVWTASGMLQGEIVKGRLEAEGFPVLLRYESAGPVLGLTVDGLGEVRVMVPESMADEAKALLQSDPPTEERLDPEG